MSTTIILFINGAPRSGKDTTANLIETAYDVWGEYPKWEPCIAPVKTHLVNQTRTFFDISLGDWEERYSLFKDEPWSLLYGMSQREALIWMSEEVTKPKFGRDFYGLIHAGIIEDISYGNTVVLIPDSGFIEEIYPVMNKFGRENCYMVNTFRTGTSFQNDSRSLITGDMLNIPGYELVNRGSTQDLKKDAVKILREVLEDAESKNERRHAS